MEGQNTRKKRENKNWNMKTWAAAEKKNDCTFLLWLRSKTKVEKSTNKHDHITCIYLCTNKIVVWEWLRKKNYEMNTANVWNRNEIIKCIFTIDYFNFRWNQINTKILYINFIGVLENGEKLKHVIFVFHFFFLYFVLFSFPASNRIWIWIHYRKMKTGSPRDQIYTGYGNMSKEFFIESEFEKRHCDNSKRKKQQKKIIIWIWKQKRKMWKRYMHLNDVCFCLANGFYMIFSVNICIMYREYYCYEWGLCIIATLYLLFHIPFYFWFFFLAKWLAFIIGAC